MYTALRNTNNKGVYLKKDLKKEWRVPGASIRDFQDNELEKALSWTKTKKLKTVKPEKNVKAAKSDKNKKNVKPKAPKTIKTTVALEDSEYELMSRILESDGIMTMENIEVAEVLDAFTEYISAIEYQDSWADDFDWNTRMFLHCQGEIDLCGGNSDAYEERSLLSKFEPLWREDTDVFVDIVLKR